MIAVGLDTTLLPAPDPWHVRDYDWPVARRVRARSASKPDKEEGMATPERRGGIGGISAGGIIVIVGIVLMVVWSFWIGLIVVLVGLIAFGGFARGRWY
jgi:hypothetical protein